MALNRVEGDLYVGGRLTVNAFTPPNESIGSAQFSGGDPLVTEKQRTLYSRIYGQPDGGSAIDEIRCIHVALAEGVLEQFQAGLRVASIGDSTITVDLRKNGVSVLSDVIDLDSSIEEYDQVVAGIDPALETYVQGDVFEIVVTVTDGTGTPGEGLFALAAFDEGPL